MKGTDLLSECAVCGYRFRLFPPYGCPMCGSNMLEIKNPSPTYRCPKRLCRSTDIIIHLKRKHILVQDGSEITLKISPDNPPKLDNFDHVTCGACGHRNHLLAWHKDNQRKFPSWYSTFTTSELSVALILNPTRYLAWQIIRTALILELGAPIEAG